MPRQHSDSQEFSRFVEADSVGTHRMERRISANPEERAALAKRFGLIGIDRLEAVFSLKRAGGGVIHVAGEIAAEEIGSIILAPLPDDWSEDDPEAMHAAEDAALWYEQHTRFRLGDAVGYGFVENLVAPGSPWRGIPPTPFPDLDPGAFDEDD